MFLRTARETFDRSFVRRRMSVPRTNNVLTNRGRDVRSFVRTARLQRRVERLGLGHRRGRRGGVARGLLEQREVVEGVGTGWVELDRGVVGSACGIELAALSQRDAKRDGALVAWRRGAEIL